MQAALLRNVSAALRCVLHEGVPGGNDRGILPLSTMLRIAWRAKDGHNAAFAFFGGVPLSILYDNTIIAVAKILGDGKRKRTRVFSELQSHYLFEDKFGRPGKGNDKGNVEGVVGYGRRNFLVPAPRFDRFDELNAHLEQQCLKRQDDIVRGHSEMIGERMMRDPLPVRRCLHR